MPPILPGTPESAVCTRYDVDLTARRVTISRETDTICYDTLLRARIICQTTGNARPLSNGPAQYHATEYSPNGRQSVTSTLTMSERDVTFNASTRSCCYQRFSCRSRHVYSPSCRRPRHADFSS